MTAALSAITWAATALGIALYLAIAFVTAVFAVRAVWDWTKPLPKRRRA